MISVNSPLRRARLLLVVLAITAGPVRSSEAHLCIIRQGLESSAVMEANDEYGHALASGDFDNDGFKDLAVGCPLEDGGALSASGAVIVSYGSETGLTHVGAHTLEADDVGGTVVAGEQFGFALAVGKFNDDDYDDLAIGVPGWNGAAGEVRIVYGSATGLSGAASSFVSQANSPGAVESNDAFGFSLAVGDFNNDNLDDLAVGIPGEDLETGPSVITNAGAIEIYFGDTTALTTAGAYIITDDDTPNPAAAGAQFGYALAGGNFDGDLFDDLAVGIPFKNTSGPADHGVLQILFGSAGGVTATGVQFLSQTSLGEVNETNDRFGSVLAAGNFNGDAYDDLAMGIPLKDVNPFSDVGVVIVAPGGATGLDTALAETIQQNGFSADSHFGAALSFGDWNGNGADDLGIGVPGGFTGGRVWLVESTGSALDDNNPIFRTPTILNEVNEADDFLGSSLAFGSFAGGTREGLAIGAPGEDYEPMPGVIDENVLANAGAVYVDMPWKQVQNLTSRTAMMVDCDGNIIFSQKPFTRHSLASTSKIMTALLGCEATQGGCNPCVALNDVYTFPPIFGGGNITGGTLGGSMARWCPGEQTTFRDLLSSCLLISGNDSAFSIADHVFNSGSNCGVVNCPDLVNFVTRMNTRAGQLGMTMTQFENPSGGGHQAGGWASRNLSTCWDMHLLSDFAMQNPLFHQIASQATDMFPRTWATFGQGQAMQCVQGNNNFQMTSLQFPIPGGSTPDFPNGTGVKGGGGNNAGFSFIGSADLTAGRMFSFVFGCPTNAGRRSDTIALMSLASNQYCELPFVAPPPPPGFVLRIPSVSTDDGDQTTWPIFFEGEQIRTRIRASLPLGSGATSAQFAIRRTREIELGPGESSTFTIGPFLWHDGIHVTNLGSGPVDTRLEMNYGTSPVMASLNAGDVMMVSPHAESVVQPLFTATLTNDSSTTTTTYEIFELGYALDFALTATGDGFAVEMSADLSGGEDTIELTVAGTDPVGGNPIDLEIADTLDDPGCDGVLDILDVDPFVLALTDPAAYVANFPYCYFGSADFNGDGRVDGNDVQAFVEALVP